MNGGIRNNGVMFEIETKRAIRLTAIDIHTPLRETIPVTVYTASGGLAGKEQDSSKWNKIMSTNVMGKGDHKYTQIVVPNPLVISGGTKLAFYRARRRCARPSSFAGDGCPRGACLGRVRTERALFEILNAQRSDGVRPWTRTTKITTDD